MPVANNAANAVGGSLPKWQLALAVGAPVALGLGYMYYKNSSQEKKSKDADKRNGTTDKQLSIDGDSPGNSSVAKAETSAARALRYKKQGNDAFSAKRYDEAISFYNKAIETCPAEDKEELAKNYQNRAAAYEALGKYSAVKDDCSKALELNPKYIKALLRRAKVLEVVNDLELALEDATAACLLQGFTVDSSMMLIDRILRELGKQHAEEFMKNRKVMMPSKYFINTYFKSFKQDPIQTIEPEELLKEENKCIARVVKAMEDENYDDVIGICDEEIEKYGDENNDNKMKLHLIRGTFQLLLGHHEKACSDFGIVIDSDCSSDDSRVNALIKRSVMNMQLEKRDECFDDFEQAIKINRNCGDIYHHRGQVNLLLDELEKALQDSRKALELNADGAAFAQKCYIEYRVIAMQCLPEKFEEVIDNFEKAFELYPDCCECYTLYAQMLCDSRAYAKANEYYTKANEIEPKNATIYVHRGLLHLQWTGDVIKGVELLTKALEIDDKCQLAYETLGTIEVQRGNLQKAIDIFDKALELGRTNVELTHIFSLRNAAKAQLKIVDKFGTNIMPGIQGAMS